MIISVWFGSGGPPAGPTGPLEGDSLERFV